MSRRLCGLALLFAVALAAPAADVNRQDPQAVASAYLQAVKARDAQAALALVTPDKGVTAFLKVAVAQMKQGPEADALTPKGLSELALMPMGLGGGQTLGVPAATAETTTFALRSTFELASQLVLRKQPDGTWAVDLRASLQATAGGGQSTFVKVFDMMGGLPESSVATVESQVQQPWECVNKMRPLHDALMAWAEEHGGKYPLAAVWMDQLEPYLEKTPGGKPFACPSHADEEFSFAFNAELSSQPLVKGWEEQNRTAELVCLPGDKPNLTFKPAELEKLKPRHGTLNVCYLASGQQLMLPERWGLDKLWAEDKANNDCQSKLRALVAALKEYAKAHNGRLPAAATWCDDLEPLLKAKDERPFACPSQPPTACCYAYNQELGGAELAKLVNHRRLVAFMELGPGPRNRSVAPQAVGRGGHRHAWNSGGAPSWHRVMLSGLVDSVGEPK